MSGGGTYLAARSVGGGKLLTGPLGTYKVSDWSPGTGQVYGYRQVGRGWGAYQLLPQGLSAPVVNREVL